MKLTYAVFNELVEMWASGDEEAQRSVIDQHLEFYDLDTALGMIDMVVSVAKSRGYVEKPLH